jgi:hypothetical protein
MLAEFVLSLALEGNLLDTVPQDARRRAERENRPILVYLYDTTCVEPPKLDDRVPAHARLLRVFSRCVVVAKDLQDESASMTLSVLTPEGKCLLQVSESNDRAAKDQALERLADGLEASLRGYEREQADFLNYLFSRRPVTDGDGREIAKLVEQLGAEEPVVRERATTALARYGYPALVLLRAAPRPTTDVEVCERILIVLRELEGRETFCQAGGWERNVSYLAVHPDSRAQVRLDRILAEISASEDVSLGDMDPESFEEWWARMCARVRWSPVGDCYTLGT